MLQLEFWRYPHQHKPCPYCSNGIITTTPKMIYQETRTSQVNNDYQPVGIVYPSAERLGSALLRCDSCSEFLLTQYLELEDVRDVDEVGIEHLGYSCVQYFPSPPIIEVPPSCPEAIKETLKTAFPLFWIDLPSCANKIRVAIELLMKAQGMDRPKEKLHHWIERFSEVQSELGRFLMSIKWLGNTGSHAPTVTKEDVVDAFLLVEHVLSQLYPDRKQELVKISDRLTEAHRRKS